jgi:hypothetical protein
LYFFHFSHHVVNNFFHFAEIQMSCMVWGCSNSNLATADPSVHYYVFPKHPMIAQQWIDACGWPPDQMDPNIGKKINGHSLQSVGECRFSSHLFGTF